MRGRLAQRRAGLRARGWSTWARAFAWGDHGSSWIDEGTPQRPAPLGAGDADVARRLLALREERGLDVVFVALGLVYGPGGLLRARAARPRARASWGGAATT